MITIDLNADLGEGMPWDFELLKRISSASVSCGAHAGEPEQILATLEEAKKRGVVVGAHPSWPDRAEFGRVAHPVSREEFMRVAEVIKMIIGQVEQLKTLADAVGVAIWYLKPHGALYNQAMSGHVDDLGVTSAVDFAARRLELPLMGMPDTEMERRAKGSHVGYIREGFPDRRYGPMGRLLPRSRSDALIHDPLEAVEQALRLIEHGVESLCLHGDAPTSVTFADALRERFDREGIVVRSFLDRA